MKKLILAATVICTLISLFTGCQSNVNSSGVSSSPSVSPSLEPSADASSSTSGAEGSVATIALETPRIETMLSSGIAVNADVNIPQDMNIEKLAIYQGTLQRLSAERVKDNLLGKTAEVTEDRQPTKESRFSDAEYILFGTSNGDTLVNMGESLFYTSAEFGDILYYFDGSPTSQNYNGNVFLTGNSLSFGTPSSCFKEIKNLLQLLDISVTENFQCYTLDHNTLLQEAEKYRASTVENVRESGITNEDGSPLTEADILRDLPEPNYTEETDCYFFKIHASANGFPLTAESNGKFESGGLIPGTTIEAVYSKNGIVFLNVNNVYQPQEILREEKGLSLEDALAKLDEKYNSIILEGDYEVTDITFEYIPISKGGSTEVELVPAWRFSVGHMTKHPDKSEPNKIISTYQYSQVMINAISGKEILKDDSI